MTKYLKFLFILQVLILSSCRYLPGANFLNHLRNTRNLTERAYAEIPAYEAKERRIKENRARKNTFSHSPSANFQPKAPNQANNYNNFVNHQAAKIPNQKISRQNNHNGNNTYYNQNSFDDTQYFYEVE